MGDGWHTQTRRFETQERAAVASGQGLNGESPAAWHRGRRASRTPAPGRTQSRRACGATSQLRHLQLAPMADNEQAALEDAAFGFLGRHLPQPWDAAQAAAGRAAPFTTLTYAQSLDGFIARPGQQVALSSRASMVLTHALRASHDAILVGIGTLLCDNPSLSTRFVTRGPPPHHASPPSHPRPVILDSKLQCPLSCKAMDRRPLVLTVESTDAQTLERRLALTERGAVVVTVPHNAQGRIDIAAALAMLRSRHGIRSVMIEGGSQVIRECLSSQAVAIDRLIVTVAPMLLGSGVHALAGMGMSSDAGPPSAQRADHADMPRLADVVYEQFGRDMVMAASVVKTA
ncbi:dihydrofolate reductase-like domain-containing protein [Entophlyctis helioformis]|nr:dihydrofolate reductase-like domain-containing protein [Entophlyctis helioformis]